MLRSLGLATIFVMCGVAAPASAEPFPPSDSRFISLYENGLRPDGLPQLPYLETIDEAQATAFFNQVRAEGMENRYIIGSCDDRAHFIALLAARAGIRLGKVWAVAPSRYMLLNKSSLSVPDPSGIANGNVRWGYHVAPVLRVRRGGEERTLVLDRSMDANDYLPVQEWATRPVIQTFYCSSRPLMISHSGAWTVWKSKILAAAEPKR